MADLSDVLAARLAQETSTPEGEDPLVALTAELRKVEAERDKALAQVAEYEGAICWDTTCLSCATVLDSLHRETERREQVEAAIGRVRAAVHVADPEDVTDWQRGYRACSLRVVETLDEFANGGTVQSGPVRDESGCALTVPSRQTSDTSADPVGPASGAQGPWHLGRAWHGHDIEDACPCPQAPCGLVVDRTRDPNCAQHGRFGRTIRQGHPAARCPEAGSAEGGASDGR